MVKTYEETGAGHAAKTSATRELVRGITFKRRGFGRPLGPVGHFTGFVSLGEYALSLCTDGVGTKLIVASEMKKWDTVGIDCVAMNVNDTVAMGAEPIAFVDYFASEKYDKEVARQIGVGLNSGAREANVSIIGGETALLPEIVRGFDLAGSCLGIVKKDKIIDGSNIRQGHIIIGLRSSGIHSNGLSLARRVFKEAGLGLDDRLSGLNKKIGEYLLQPTMIYVRPILSVLESATVSGMIHVTGGGLRNFARLSKSVDFVIDKPIEPQPVFKAIQSLAGIDDREMFQTFNMGMGYAIIAPEDERDSILRRLSRNVQAKVVGHAERGDGSVALEPLDLHFHGY